MEAAGLVFPAAVIRGIRARIAKDEGLTRTELSREVCQWMKWQAANGQLREMTCRLALLELAQRGALVLPARRSCVRSQMPAQHWEGIDNRPLRCELAELGEIELVGVSAREDRGLSSLWNTVIAAISWGMMICPRGESISTVGAVSHRPAGNGLNKYGGRLVGTPDVASDFTE